MSNLRHSLVTLFALFAALGGDYAYSQPSSNITEYHNNQYYVLGGCALKVEKASDGIVYYTPSTESKTRFIGSGPTGSEMYLESRDGFRPDPTKGEGEGDRLLPQETLRIYFALGISGQLEPTGYIFDPVALRIRSKGLIKEKICDGLVRSNRNP